MRVVCFCLGAGFLNKILEVSVVHHPLPDLDFAVYVSDLPQLQLRDYPPGRAPLVMEYSKVCIITLWIYEQVSEAVDSIHCPGG